MKKIIKWILIVFVILFVILVSVPFLFKGKIIAKIKEEANYNINAKVDFGNVDLSLISHFPNLSLSITNLSVINEEPFAGDTLIYIKSLDVTVDLMSVITGDQIKIRKVYMDNSVMNFLVNEKGKANWDISKNKSAGGSQPSKPSSFKVGLKYYALKNSRVQYDDKTMGFRLMLNGLNHEGNGDFTQDLFTLNTHTTTDQTTVSYGGIAYLNKVKTKIDADLDMDMKNFKFTFKDNKIYLNDLDLGFSGWLAMPDTNIDMDLKFSAAKSDFKNFISLIPAVYSAEFKNATATGTLALEGWAKGRYNAKSIPGFGIKLNVDNGGLKYPSLPSDLKNVFVNLEVENPDGVADHTVVNLSRMHIEMAGAPFDAKFLLRTPISDPDFDASLKGKIDFAAIQKAIPLEKGTTLSGVLTADFNAKGKYSYVKQQKYDQFKADGSINLTGMNYTSATLKQPVQINQLAMTFNPKTVALTAFNMKAGNTDLQASGSLENFIPYALKKETLKGTLKMTSHKIDLNEWMSDNSQAAAKGDTTSLTAMEVPGNIDFVMNASIGTLIYSNITMSNCSGEITIRNKSVNLNNLKMNMLDGTMVMNGSYATPDVKKPDISFNLNITDFDVQKTATTFVTVQKMAPIAKNCSGKYSTKMELKGKLDSKMNPVMNTLNGGGSLNTTAITVAGYPPMEKVADALKMPNLKRITVPKANLSFKFTNGRVFVDPFDADIAGIKSTIAGSNGFDQTIDYTLQMQIPRAMFGGAANSVLNGLVSQANSKGASLSVGDVVPVAIKMGGTVTNPTVSTDINKAGAKAMSDLKAAAAAEFEKQKAAAEAKAKAEVEAKVKSTTDQLKKEADAKLKAAQDSIKNAAAKKAKDELQQFNPFKKK